jgi:uncharacterized oligopeptide transporter (OPT) family protein
VYYSAHYLRLILRIISRVIFIIRVIERILLRISITCDVLILRVMLRTLLILHLIVLFSLVSFLSFPQGAYMSGVVGSSNNPISGMTLATIVTSVCFHFLFILF